MLWEILPGTQMCISACMPSQKDAHVLTQMHKDERTLTHSLKRKVRPLIQTHWDPASPQVDQRPWRKTNVLTYLFLFYSLRKRPAIWQRQGTDGDCPLPESTSIYRRNLRSRSSKRMPQTGIFPQTAIVIDQRGNRNNETIQRKWFSVQ